MTIIFNGITSLLDNWWYFHIIAAVVGLTIFFFGKSFKGAAKFFLYSAVFSVLVVMISTFFPFIGGKDYFFRASIELALIFFVLWWAFEAKKGEIDDRARIVFKSPLFMAVSAFALAFLLSAIFADDPHAGFWSNYERGEGAFQMLHYYAFFVLLVFLFRDKSDWRRAFLLSLTASILMTAYGMGALFKLDGFVGPQNICDRFQGSLGNPAYVAPYLMFSMFYALWLWVTGKINAHRHALYAALFAVFVLFFLFTQTRGAFLGLGASALAVSLYLAFSLPAGKLKRISVAAFAAMLLLGSLAFVFRHKAIPLVPTCESSSRLLDISTSDQTAQTRFWTWGSAWKGFLEKPIFGWGPENFTAVFDKYFDPRHFVPGMRTETWFDRAHSVYFDYLAETGIVGLLSYLGIFATLFAGFFRRTISKSQNEPQEKNAANSNFYSGKGHNFSSVAEKGLLLALPVGYLIQGVAIFDVLPIYINLFIFLAFANYYLYGHERIS